MIYFDNSATTKPLPEVLESFQKVSKDYYGNPSSVHRLGIEANTLLRKAHEQAAALLDVHQDEIVFTSGGTEGNNLAIKGVALANQHRGKHIVTSQIEHPSVLEACRSLESLGFSITYLPIDQTGVVRVEDVEAAIRKDTILVSIMHINNELGTIQPVEAIGQIVKDLPTTYFHVDDVQGFGKTKLKLSKSGIDLYTVSGHKIHGLKGTGLLYVKKDVKLFPLFHGGSQQMNYRSGTENLAGNVSFVKAMRMMLDHQENNQDYIKKLNDHLRQALAKIPAVVVNTPHDQAPHIVNFSIPGYKPEVILHALEERNIFVSTKSACSSKKSDESAVLKAINLPRERAISAIRVSFSYQNTTGEIELFSRSLRKVIKQLSQVMG